MKTLAAVVTLIICFSGFGMSARAGSAAPACTTGQQTYLGTYVCLAKMSDLPAADPGRFPSSASFGDYYGYVTLTNTGTIQINDPTTLDTIKSLIGIKDTSSVIITVNIDLSANGTTTSLASVPIYGYSITDGKIQSGAAISLYSGIITPIFPLKNNPRVVIQYKATIYHNVDISTLTNELKAVSTASGQGWLLASVSGAAPTIEGSINGVVGQSYDVPIDVNMGFNQNQYGSVTIYGASAPGNGGSSATISVSLQHAKSLSQPLQSEG